MVDQQYLVKTLICQRKRLVFISRDEFTSPWRPADQGYVSRGWHPGKSRSRGGRACISRGRVPGIHEYRSICTLCADIRGSADTFAAVSMRFRARVLKLADTADTRGVCRCLVTRQQSPWGLNTVCTSVVRELDPMWARTNYQLIFHERALGYVPGLPNTQRNLWKLVIQPPRRERRRFIFREKTGFCDPQPRTTSLSEGTFLFFGQHEAEKFRNK